MFLKVVCSALFLYLVYCGFLFLLQRQMMFPRGQIGVPSPGMLNFPGLEKIWMNTDSGKIEAWFMPPAAAAGRDAGPAPAVIFAHGNAELIDFWPAELEPFTRLGVGVMLVEFPGYGRSEGAPSQKSITSAFVSAYDVLAARKDVDSTRIVLFGRSIGGGAVCELAGLRPSAALILMSTFTSARSFAVQFLVPGFFVRDPFNNLEIVRSYPGPVLIVHGKYDQIIPYRHARALVQAARHGKMIAYDCGHNDCPPGWEMFWEDVTAFLHEAGVLK